VQVAGVEAAGAVDVGVGVRTVVDRPTRDRVVRPGAVEVDLDGDAAVEGVVGVGDVGGIQSRALAKPVAAKSFVSATRLRCP